MCGYNFEYSISKPKSLGSSPRVRVQPSTAFINSLVVRIIPACAGTTVYLLFAFRFLQDHPRVCGYNNNLELIFFLILGSSPRVRVQLPPSSKTSVQLRIIPACAGTTQINRFKKLQS